LFCSVLLCVAPQRWLLHHTPPRMIPSTIMAPSPIKLVEPFIDFAALFVVDNEGAVEVDVDVDVDDDDDDDEAEDVMVVVIGTEK